MIFIKEIFAADDAAISTITNPATKLTGITSLGGLLTGGGFNVLNIIFVFVGLAFFVNLILTGWEYLMSSGDPKKIAAATTRITNGFTGLIMAITAFIVVRLIVSLLGLEGLI